MEKILFSPVSVECNNQNQSPDYNFETDNIFRIKFIKSRIKLPGQENLLDQEETNNQERTEAML